MWGIYCTIQIFGFISHNSEFFLAVLRKKYNCEINFFFSEFIYHNSKIISHTSFFLILLFFSVVEINYTFIFCETKQNKNIFHYYFQLASIIGLLVVEIFTYTFKKLQNDLLSVLWIWSVNDCKILSSFTFTQTCMTLLWKLISITKK